jgi:alkanesulfonate monooxygenase SsuD/methylene tetrahydromethanopterin reductase-like flavin-dependent oxidoreductase (luciferase family)
MAVKLGYLLPTRERIMAGHPETGPLLALAAQAEAIGFDSVWIGDSLLARPRHEPLTLLAAVGGRTRTVKLGTAVLLPALRNPVIMAHQIATLDQASDGRVILGVGIAGDVPNIRREFEAAGVPFEKRVGRLLEGLRLCQALWTGQPVDWDGRWKVDQGVLAPTPVQPGGPPIWMGGGAPAGLIRAGREWDGWFPTGPDATGWARKFAEVKQAAKNAGRDPDKLTGALYLTVAIDEDRARGDAAVNQYLQDYYGVPAAVIRKRQACFSGNRDDVRDWLKGYVDAGVEHLVLRFVGDHDRHLETVADFRAELG